VAKLSWKKNVCGKKLVRVREFVCWFVIVRVCICIYMHVYLYIYMYVYVCIYIDICFFKYVYKYTAEENGRYGVALVSRMD